MLLEVPPDVADAILRAMHRVVVADGLPPSRADASALAGAWRTVFGRQGPVPTAPIDPTELASTVADPVDRMACVRLCAVMAFDVAAVDRDRMAEAEALAAALDVHTDATSAVHHLLADDVAWAAADQIRHNVATIPGMPFDADAPYAAFLPYRDGNEDPALEARYEALGQLPDGSFGLAFFHHYRDNGFAFPGNPDAVVERWATMHDSLHLLSGYSTSAQGEILVAAFTTGQFQPQYHPAWVDPMESHILPTIFIYSLGIDINKGLNKGDRERIAADPTWAEDFTGNVHLGLDAAKLWVALDRGSAMTEDLYSGHWDFWAHVTTPLEDLRAAYSVPPLDPADAALDDDQVDPSRFDRG